MKTIHTRIRAAIEDRLREMDLDADVLVGFYIVTPEGGVSSVRFARSPDSHGTAPNVPPSATLIGPAALASDAFENVTRLAED